jgi:hypothetical protein
VGWLLSFYCRELVGCDLLDSSVVRDSILTVCDLLRTVSRSLVTSRRPVRGLGFGVLSLFLFIYMSFVFILARFFIFSLCLPIFSFSHT